MKGLGVRRQRRDAIYVLKYRFKGRQRFVTIGRHGSPRTPFTARREAKRLLGLVADGIDPAAERDAAKEQPTMADFKERYIAEYAVPRKKPRTIEEEERLFRLHILPALGAKRLGDVTRADVARLHRGRTVHPANANRCLALISHLFTIALRCASSQAARSTRRALSRSLRQESLRQEKSLRAAAKAARISPKRLNHYAVSKGAIPNR